MGESFHLSGNVYGILSAFFGIMIMMLFVSKEGKNVDFKSPKGKAI